MDKGKHAFGVVTVGEKGQIVIPAKARKVFERNKEQLNHLTTQYLVSISADLTSKDALSCIIMFNNKIVRIGDLFMRNWKIGLLTLAMALSMTACASTEVAKIDKTEQTVIVETDVVDISESTVPLAEDVEESSVVETSTVAAEAIEVTETFQSLFAKHGMKAGTCLSDFMIRDTKCQDFIKANFNSITFENHMKPDYILDQKASVEAGDLVVSFNDATKALLKWCSDNEMAMRGHTLVWHSQTPNWIFYENFDTNGQLVSRDTMLARMESYIKQVFQLLDEMGYLESFYAYDVVNEAWMEDGTKRESLWLQTIGEDYLWYAFYYANQYAPNYIDLYYNDYNEQFKTDTLYDFVQTLVDEEGNYLIDGVGFQAHLYTEDSLTDYFNTVDKIASLGLKINLTELDVCLGTWPDIKPPTEENLKAQGQFYYNLINGLLQRVDEGKVKMDALTFWGFADHMSWRHERSPLLLDKTFQPKYAYYGALQMKEYAGFDE